MTYDTALDELRRIGASRASDAAVMAGFCAHDIQHVVGAVAGKLVWEGAQSSGLTYLQLARMAVSDPRSVSDLQWL